jgi:cytochrome c biogenesis protein
MLGVKRRRVYVRVNPASPEGHTEITVAGLPKGSDPGLQVVVDDLLARVAAATGTPRADQPREDTA